MTDNTTKFSIVLFILAVLGNILGYWIKSILKDNNYPVKYFIHFGDTRNIFRLARSTNDKNSKVKYLLAGCIEIALSIAFIIFAALLFLSIPSVNDTSCTAFKTFKNKEYEFIIVSKYTDENQHSYPTIILQDKEGNKSKNQDFISDNSGFFNYINIGDTLRKQQGIRYTKVINATVDTAFEPNFGCEGK